MDEVMDRLRGIICLQMGVEPGQVEPGTTWRELHMEPVDVEQTLSFVEGSFGVAPKDAGETVGDVAKWLTPELHRTTGKQHAATPVSGETRRA